jgi:hypothetical protein
MFAKNLLLFASKFNKWQIRYNYKSKGRYNRKLRYKSTEAQEKKKDRKKFWHPAPVAQWM